MSKNNLSRTITGGWVAMQEQYFVSAWIPYSKAHNHFFSRVHDKDIYTIGYVAPELSVPADLKPLLARECMSGLSCKKS